MNRRFSIFVPIHVAVRYYGPLKEELIKMAREQAATDIMREHHAKRGGSALQSSDDEVADTGDAGSKGLLHLLCVAKGSNPGHVCKYSSSDDDDDDDSVLGIGGDENSGGGGAGVPQASSSTPPPRG